MDGGSSSTSNVGSLQGQMHCPDSAVKIFYYTLGRQIWLGNALLLASASITAVLVGIGGYVRRYRHHPLTRFIFIGANTLFLPIISYVVSTLSDSNNDYVKDEDNGTTLAALCDSDLHPCMVVTWAFLVQIVAINTTSVVAIGNREGRKLGPPLELLVKGIWIVYLGASITKKQFFHGFLKLAPFANDTLLLTTICAKIMFAPFVLICAKFWFKLYAFEKAQVSFALKRNPSLIYGYMQQLQRQEGVSQQGEPLVGEEAYPPPLLVMGEYRKPVEKQPRGHVFSSGSVTSMIDNTRLVTLDKVWQLYNVLPTLTRRQKDLCMSFALFKLLRCRFARYKLADVSSAETIKFFWSLLLTDGEHDRIFSVVGNEISFIHDYYYSSVPISYAKCCLPALSIFISLLCIGYCIVAAYFTMFFAVLERGSEQINCHFWCIKKRRVSGRTSKTFGSLYFDVVPVCFLLLLVLISEVRDMASYICSNWTKVSIICDYVNRAYSSLRHPLRMNKWVVILLRCNCKQIMRHWNENMGQCSVLVFHQRTTLLGLLGRLLHLPDQKGKVKLPEAVKFHIICALRSIKSNRCRLSNGAASLRRSRVGERLLWACNSNSTYVTILTWHIATSILEVRHPYQHQQGQDSSPAFVSECKIAATHLSRYCAYLVTWCAELLPDDVAWSTSLYEAIKKDAERVLLLTAARRTGSTTPEAEYQVLVDLLGGYSTHEVLKNGVKLGKQLVELAEGEETVWKLLAGFWSENILFVAPSET